MGSCRYASTQKENFAGLSKREKIGCILVKLAIRKIKTL